jgi:hypothetical protein
MHLRVRGATAACHAEPVNALRYCLVVDGELGPRYEHAFEGMELSTGDGKTELTGSIVDPAQMLGLLERIAGLGLTLRSVTPLDTPE